MLIEYPSPLVPALTYKSHLFIECSPQSFMSSENAATERNGRSQEARKRMFERIWSEWGKRVCDEVVLMAGNAKKALFLSAEILQRGPEDLLVY